MHMVGVADMTESQLVESRRTVYFAIESGLSYEEWTHKLINLAGDPLSSMDELFEARSF